MPSRQKTKPTAILCLKAIPPPITPQPPLENDHEILFAASLPVKNGYDFLHFALVVTSLLWEIPSKLNPSTAVFRR